MKDIRSRAPEFTSWLNRFFDAYYKYRPVNATFIGVHDWDERLPDFSENGAGDTLADMQSLLLDGRGMNREPLSTFESIDQRLALGFLEIQIWEFKSNHFQRGNPSLYAGEAVFGVMSLFLSRQPGARHPLDASTDSHLVDSAIQRMNAIPELLAQGQHNITRAPLDWTERALRECKGAVLFLTDGIDPLVAAYEITDPQFRAAADRAATAFTRFQTYLASELRRRPSEHYACGEAALHMYLRQGHFLDLEAEEIVCYAEAHMSEVASYLTEHAADFGARNKHDALAMLSDTHPSAQDYYGRYQELLDMVRETAEKERLLTWPDFPIRYLPRPDWSRKAAPYLYFLFYRSPAAFNQSVVHDYLVAPIDQSMSEGEQQTLLRATNDSVIKLNHVIHHGSIGHHVQNWHAFRSASRIGQVAAVDCASRIALFCGGTMAEGWACYATDVMNEAGFLTPLEQYAQHQARVRMCVRAIVDVRLHQGRYTLAQAAAYYEEQAGLSRDAALAEAVKNSMFPGAAVIYLMGTDAIHRLRSEMAARRRNRFNLCKFHDEFLSYGSIPVTLIIDDMKRKEDEHE